MSADRNRSTDKFQSRDELVSFIEEQTATAVEKAAARRAARAVGHIRAGRPGLGRVLAC